jgi:hypothetical protein
VPLASLSCPVAVLKRPVAEASLPHSVDPIAAPSLQSAVASAAAGTA